MRVTALATPGHTYTHLSYALTDAEDGATIAVFSGGSLLYGATGRPDLLGPEHTRDLARLQHGSAHKLAQLLPDSTGVYPTHGFGSFCSANQSDAVESTIGREREVNSVLSQDEETWVEELIAGLGAYPAYYAHMGPANAAGPGAPDLSPPSPADAAELRRRIESGEWVVDLRNRTVFAAAHAPGTLNFGLDGSFATYLGWMVAWGTPVTLLGETAADVADAQRELVRIGIDRPAAHATGGPEKWTEGELRSFPTGTFADLAQVRHHREVIVLDVRRDDEHAEAGSPAPSTSLSRTCPPGSPRCRRGRCGCTAPVATAPRWPPRSSMRPATARSRSTTTSTTRVPPASTWSRRWTRWLTIANLYL